MASLVTDILEQTQNSHTHNADLEQLMHPAIALLYFNETNYTLDCYTFIDSLNILFSC